MVGLAFLEDDSRLGVKKLVPVAFGFRQVRHDGRAAFDDPDFVGINGSVDQLQFRGSAFLEIERPTGLGRSQRSIQDEQGEE